MSGQTDEKWLLYHSHLLFSETFFSAVGWILQDTVSQNTHCELDKSGLVKRRRHEGGNKDKWKGALWFSKSGVWEDDKFTPH